jgi:hypothetical protein
MDLHEDNTSLDKDKEATESFLLEVGKNKAVEGMDRDTSLVEFIRRLVQ